MPKINYNHPIRSMFIYPMLIGSTFTLFLYGGVSTGAILGVQVSAMRMLTTRLVDRTPESVIKEPAERLQKDLQYIDDTIERLYQK